MLILLQFHWPIIPMCWEQNHDSVSLLFTTPTGFGSWVIWSHLLSSTLQLKTVNEETEDRALWHTTRDFPESWTCIFGSALKGGFWSIFSVFYMWDYIFYPNVFFFEGLYSYWHLVPLETNPVSPAEMESHSYKGDWSLLTQVGRILHCLCSPVLLTWPGSLVPSSTWSIQHYWMFWFPKDHFLGSPLRIWNISVTSPKAAVKLLAFFFFLTTLLWVVLQLEPLGAHGTQNCLALTCRPPWHDSVHGISSLLLDCSIINSTQLPQNQTHYQCLNFRQAFPPQFPISFKESPVF